MNKINVCFFSGDITRSGGTERVATLIANKLQKDEKYNISIVSLTERKHKPFFKLDDSIQRFRLYDKEVRGITHILGYIHRLKTVVKCNKVDVLIDIDGIIDMYAVPVKWMTGVKVISWEHFNYYFHPSQKLRQKVRAFAVKRVDAIVTLTEQDKEYYSQNLKFHCPIVSIHNPVTFTGIDNQYNAESKTIISVGRLTYQKGFDRLIDVAQIVLTKHPDYEWIIMGDGEDSALLQEIINSKKLTDRLKLLGNVNNIDEYYKKSSIFVMTSRFEGLPMTLLEAKYYQLPIVSYDIKTGPRECITDGINGYLIKEGDAKDMAEKIEKLINNREKRICFSKNSLIDVEKFSMEAIIMRWEKLIEKVI